MPAPTSPLDARHRALGAKLVPFGGWEMPLAYPSGTLAEHRACRADAAVFDVSHLGTVRVDGAAALGTLQAALTNDLGKIAPGRTQYTHLLDEADGSVVDDIIVWWVGPERFDVMPNASNTARVREAIGGTDVTTERAILAVQGPGARERLGAVSEEAAAVPRRGVAEVEVLGAPCVVAGTGYTGEDGVELAVPAEAAGEVWDAVLAAGIPPAGLGARDTLRLEAGLPLHGHELGPGITPLQAGLGWVVAWDKGDFRGRKALEAERDAGVARLLRGIEMEGRRPPREDQAVVAAGEVAGVVTSGNFSPVLERGIGLALVRPDLEVGTAVEVDQRGTLAPGRVVKPPFVEAGQGKGIVQPMGHFVPHTDEEIADMLAFLGLRSLDELFAVVPEALRLNRDLDIAPGLSEPDVGAEMGRLAAANAAGDLVCFVGGGAYDHEIPAAVRRVAFRSEFVTAYTPYQAEVAQGVLQALFEYQTMISRLTGVAVANASLYDGATACVEAVNLAVAAAGRSTVWVSRGVNPNWRETLRTFAAGTGHDLVEVPLEGGVTRWPDGADGEAPAALLLQSPGYLGCLEDVAAARRVADTHGALLLVAVDPVGAGLLRTAGSQGADVVVGEGQPLGTPLGFGGPYLGLFACTLEHVRRLPGRLVGETVDVEGRRAYVTTLRTREQDIRREKASSNVCTNQTLIAVVCALQLAWLGTGGLRELALRCARATRFTREALLAVDGVEPLVEAPVLREFAVRLPVDPTTVVERMAEEGFLAGVPLGDEYGAGLLVAATERRTRAEIEAYADAIEKVLR